MAIVDLGVEDFARLLAAHDCVHLQIGNSLYAVIRGSDSTIYRLTLS